MAKVNQTKSVKNLGKFQEVLSRDGNQIKESRALSIKEDALICYKRNVEDIQRNLVKLERERDDMLDMCPDDVNSIISAKNFEAEKFYGRDLELSLKIDNEKRLLDIMKARLVELFGEENGL